MARAQGGTDQGGGHTLTMTASEASVLEAVRRAGTVARADLVARTALSQQSVHRLSEDLVARGLLARLPAEIRGPGKPSPRLTLAANGASASA